MSPEQASGKSDLIDGRTDLFALAATGFRLRADRRIHDRANAVELVTKMANIAAPRIRTVAPDVSDPFARVIDRGLEFRREDRYQSAAEMREDVARARCELEALALAQEDGALARAPAWTAEPTIEVSTRDLDCAVRSGEASARRVAGRRWPARSVLAFWLGLVLMVVAGVWPPRRTRPAFGRAPQPVGARAPRYDPATECFSKNRSGRAAKTHVAPAGPGTAGPISTSRQDAITLTRIERAVCILIGDRRGGDEGQQREYPTTSPSPVPRAEVLRRGSEGRAACVTSCFLQLPAADEIESHAGFRIRGRVAVRKWVLFPNGRRQAVP